MENKLYQHFTRTGCGICQKQGSSFYEVYKHYPKTWEYAKSIELRLYEVRKKSGEKQMPSFHSKKFTLDLEKDFIKKDKQSTFELDFDPPQDCFCKI